MDELWQKFYASGKVEDYLEFIKKQGGNQDGDSKRLSDKGADSEGKR